jgi:hypothetical protein
MSILPDLRGWPSQDRREKACGLLPKPQCSRRYAISRDPTGLVKTMATEDGRYVSDALRKAINASLRIDRERCKRSNV